MFGFNTAEDRSSSPDYSSNTVEIDKHEYNDLQEKLYRLMHENADLKKKNAGLMEEKKGLKQQNAAEPSDSKSFNAFILEKIQQLELRVKGNENKLAEKEPKQKSATTNSSNTTSSRMF
jgi:hypothetical protein